MKNKSIVIILIYGLFIILIGVIFKIAHLEFGPIMSHHLLILGLLIVVYSIIKLILDNNNKNNFLNK
jgi:hypothetical protein